VRVKVPMVGRTLTESQREFKREVFKKTLRKYLREVGLDEQAFDLAEFDLDAYSSVMDLLIDVAHNKNHPYSYVCERILNVVKKYEDYGINDEALYLPPEEEAPQDGTDLEKRVRDLEEDIRDLRWRISLLNDELQNVTNNFNSAREDNLQERLERISELIRRYEENIKRIEKSVKDNEQFVVQIWQKARAPQPLNSDGPTTINRRVGPKGGPTRSGGGKTRLLLGLITSTILSVMVMDILANDFSWSPLETIAYGALFVLTTIALMALEGLWTSTLSRTAQGFVAGYIYSEYTNFNRKT